MEGKDSREANSRLVSEDGFANNLVGGDDDVFDESGTESASDTFQRRATGSSTTDVPQRKHKLSVIERVRRGEDPFFDSEGNSLPNNDADTSLNISQMMVSEHIGSLLEKIETDNEERNYRRRESALYLLTHEDPIEVKVYQKGDAGRYGFSLRGGGKAVVEGDDSSRGQYIRSVDLDSPADQAGLQAGDRILAVNDVPCEGQCHEFVRDMIMASDTPLKLLIIRDSKLGEKAKRTTQQMVTNNLQEVLNEETGNPVLTAEMKGQRLGRTKKFVEILAQEGKGVFASDYDPHAHEGGMMATLHEVPDEVVAITHNTAHVSLHEQQQQQHHGNKGDDASAISGHNRTPSVHSLHKPDHPVTQPIGSSAKVTSHPSVLEDSQLYGFDDQD